MWYILRILKTCEKGCLRAWAVAGIGTAGFHVASTMAAHATSHGSAPKHETAASVAVAILELLMILVILGIPLFTIAVYYASTH